MSKPRKGLRERGMIQTWWKKTTQNHMKRVKHGPPRLTLMQWIKRVKEFDNTCAYCGQKPDEGELLEIEHLIPLSRGGYHRIENVVPACPTCNKKKGQMTYEEFISGQDIQTNAGRPVTVERGPKRHGPVEVAEQAGVEQSPEEIAEQPAV